MPPAGCGTAVSASSSASGDGARLRLTTLAIDGAVLRLAYAFYNDERRNAYLFNRLYTGIDAAGVYKTSPDLVNVETNGDGVLLSKRIVPVPRNMKVEVPRVPALTRVAPGAEVRETLALSLPLRPWTPYFRPRDEELPDEAVSLPGSFQVGFFHTDAEGDAILRTVQTLQGPAPFFSLTAQHQQVLGVRLGVMLPLRRPRNGPPRA